MSATSERQTPGMGAPRLELRRISKRFPGCVANDAIDLAVMPGEIHALLGENGAGKSTLVKIVYGLLRTDSGEFLWEGTPVSVASPAAARRLGIGMVFQHFSLFETLTVAENVALGINFKGPIRALAERIEAVGGTYGLAIAPDRHVHALSVGERQRVEIIRCLLQDPHLLIMDEPTSVLTPQEAETLFETLRRLSEEGRSILYISHKLEEIRALCDRATILRAGRVVARCDPRAESAARLAALMIGNDVASLDRPVSGATRDDRFAVSGLHVPADGPFGTAVVDATFSVGAGEVFGIAGVAGNGQRELMQALHGEVRADRPEAIRFDGRAIGHLGARQRRDLGIAFVPDERIGHGAVPDMTLTENALLTGYRRRHLVGTGLVDFGATRRFTDAILDAFRVVGGDHRANARNLSGGNLQKFIIGREILQKPALLITASPTWGVDAGAAASIRQALLDLAAEGAAVLIVSPDLEELLEIADRIAVMAGGRLSASIARADATPERLGLLMAGAGDEDAGQRAAS